MSHRERDVSNLQRLEQFWRRWPFHDAAIEQITAINKRVIIRLTDWTLVVTIATQMKRCELPATWLYESLSQKSGAIVLDVETDTGHLLVTGGDIRLIRNSDMAMIVPPIDV